MSASPESRKSQLRSSNNMARSIDKDFL